MLKISRQIFLSHIKTGQGAPSSVVLHRKYQQKPMRLYSSDKDDISYDLTKHEALTFLEDVLGIPDPVSFVQTDKVAFLQEMIRQTKLKIPFTNIYPAIFRHSSLKELKQALFKREGGHCMALNTFTSAVLQCLGFDTYLIGGSIQRWKLPLYNSHTAVIAKHLTNPSSLHLVDVGSQYFLPPISLDFDRISQVYDIRSLQYRFFQVSPGVVQLTRKCEAPNPSQGNGLICVENDGCWEVLTTFRTLTPRKLAECHYQTEVMIQTPELIPEASEDIAIFGYPDNLFVSITKNRCLTATETGHTEVTQMKNSTHMIDTILKYFPQYSQNHLESRADYYAEIAPKKNTS